MTSNGYETNGLMLVFRENIQRYFQPFDYKKPFYVCFYYLPILFMPWTPLLITALSGTVAFFKDSDEKTRWLAKATVVIFLFFIISGSRRSYYFLPLLPFCALLTSVFLVEERRTSWKRTGFLLQKGLFVVVALIEILSPVAWHVLKGRLGFVAPMHLRLVTPILGLLAVAPWIVEHFSLDLLRSRTETGSNAALLIISATVLMGGYFCLQQNSLETYRTEKAFAEELKGHIAGLLPGKIAFYRDASPNILFYLNLKGYPRELKNPDSVRRFLESDQRIKVLVSRQKYISQLVPVLSSEHVRLPTLAEKIYPWQKPVSRRLVAWKIEVNEEP